MVLGLELRWWDYDVLGVHCLKNINYYGYKHIDRQFDSSDKKQIINVVYKI